MKLLSFILAIIIVGSVLVPCSDEIDDSSGQQEISVNQNGDHDDKGDIDFCPPLCSCHCCHSHITTSNFLVFISHTQLSQELTFFYSDQLLTISFSIWQPPKIA